MDAIVILDAHGNEQLVTESLAELLPVLEPVAERLGCLEELDGVRTIMRRGASYQRQRRVARRNDGDLDAVVAALVAELKEIGRASCRERVEMKGMAEWVKHT